jgi:micrococcal nuclease
MKFSKKDIKTLNKQIEKILATDLGKILFILLIGVFCVLIITIPAVQTAFVEITGLNSSSERIQNRKLPDGVEKVKILQVVDGDTVVLENGDKVRYLNIDTPETKKPNTPVQCYGPEASSFNKQLVENKTVYMTADKSPTDRYDRLLRFVFLSLDDTKDIDKSVNAKMVKLGYARASIYKPNNTYERNFRGYELDAKKANLGIWKNCPKPFEE